MERLRDIFITTPPDTVQEHESRQTSRIVATVASAAGFLDAAPNLAYSLAESAPVSLQIVAGIGTVIFAAGMATMPWLHRKAERRWNGQNKVPRRKA